MDETKFKQLLERIETLKKDNKFDLSVEEDLSIAIMNLVSLEEHFFFSGAKTGKEDYYEMLKETREIRKKLLARMMDQNEAESWCISKHLLATTMRLIEVGTKYYKDDKKEEAKEVFAQAFKIYSMFWALRLKVIDVDGVKKVPEEEGPWTTEDIVKKLVDCCKE